MEFGFKMFDGNREVINVSTSSMEGPWLPRWFSLIYMAAGRRGGTLDAADNLYNWVQSVPAFENVVYEQYWVPSSPWLEGDDDETKRLNELGTYMREDILVGVVFCTGCCEAEN